MPIQHTDALKTAKQIHVQDTKSEANDRVLGGQHQSLLGGYSRVPPTAATI